MIGNPLEWKLEYPNDVRTPSLIKAYTYDPASQVTNILHQLTASSTQINKADYVYNNVGNRTSLTDRRGNQAFGYDSLDRLTSASHPLLGTPQAFSYDPVGNRTTGGSVVNTGNQLTDDATHAYQYDDNGNLTRKTLLATGNYTQYSYDAENRLTKVEDFVAGNATAAFTSTYRYDGLGRRIEKVANGQTKRYIYDGEDILLEYDGSNVLQARYTHGPGIDEPIAVTKGSSTYFYHQDGLGSVTDLTDSAGATAKSYAYDAYGNILESPGTLEQPYTYTGREFDSESGLLYYRARYYDPTTGRFLQKDPIGLAGGLNLYGYVDVNPVNYTDPSGECPWCVAAALGGLTNLGVQLIFNGGQISCVDWWEVLYSSGASGAGIGLAQKLGKVSTQFAGPNRPTYRFFQRKGVLKVESHPISRRAPDALSYPHLHNDMLEDLLGIRHLPLIEPLVGAISIGVNAAKDDNCGCR